MRNEYDITMPCPCRSGNSYGGCCQPFHQGKLPDTALKLMRSRYAAYALCLPQYIIQTTHRANPHFSHNSVDWGKKITEFSMQTEFKNLKILEFQENNSFATVTFFAHLIQDHKDVSFTEKSYFENVKNKWLYRDGQITLGPTPTLGED